MTPAEQLARIKARSERLIGEEALLARLASGKPLRVKLAHRAAVGALHVIGKDFEFRLGIRGGRPVKQHGSDRLHSIGAIGALGARTAAGAARCGRR